MMAIALTLTYKSHQFQCLLFRVPYREAIHFDAAPLCSLASTPQSHTILRVKSQNERPKCCRVSHLDGKFP